MISVLLVLACQGDTPAVVSEKALQTLIQLDAGAADLTLRDMDGARALDLVSVAALLEGFLEYVIIILIVVFHQELRRLLIR